MPINQKAIFTIPLMILAGCGASNMEQSRTPASEIVEGAPELTDADIQRVEEALIAKHGQASAERVRRGLRQVRERWHAEDGDGDALAEFAEQHFISDEVALRDTAEHLEYALEMIDGHFNEMNREISRFQELAAGPMRPVDSLLSAYSPAAHVNEDLFRNKIAFAALLNFPVTKLEQRVTSGASWSRETWALARLTERFEYRLPAKIGQEIGRVSSAADLYIDNYNICMDRLVLGGEDAGFDEGQKLISHWGLRDEIRALYAEGEKGVPRQRLIATIMERIIRQEIPASIIDDATLEWDPITNRVRSEGGEWQEAEREADERYRVMLDVYRAHRAADPYFPTMPTHIDRAFEQDREIPEARMRELLESILTSETATHVGAFISQRLGRPLEPYDLWYAGFRAGVEVDEEELSAVTRERYPNAAAFDQDVARILGELGFAEERARFLADHIVVDAARGAGHALGAHHREDSAHLRTRIGDAGMDYKGFNIAVHELGHNVEQVISMSLIDHTLLEGVPNTGFTEAFAFLFQARDLQLLGRPTADRELADAMRILDRFWSTYEIAGVAIIDIEVWHWMYEHPDATPAELREAMVTIAQDVWNRYYAQVFGRRDEALLAIYSHVIAYGLYTPDYPLGFIITTQVEQYMSDRNLATEMERMCRLGRLTPDVWMEQAVGAPVSSRPLIDAAEAALQTVQSQPERRVDEPAST